MSEPSKAKVRGKLQVAHLFIHPIPPLPPLPSLILNPSSGPSKNKTKTPISKAYTPPSNPSRCDGKPTEIARVYPCPLQSISLCPQSFRQCPSHWASRTAPCLVRNPPPPIIITRYFIKSLTINIIIRVGKLFNPTSTSYPQH